MHSRTVQL